MQNVPPPSSEKTSTVPSSSSHHRHHQHPVTPPSTSVSPKVASSSVHRDRNSHSHSHSHSHAHSQSQSHSQSHSQAHPDSPSSFHDLNPVNFAPAHESRRRNAEQRAATLRADKLIGEVEPNRVFCSLCQKWVQLRQDSSYCAYPWLQHRGKCLARQYVSFSFI